MVAIGRGTKEVCEGLSHPFEVGLEAGRRAVVNNVGGKKLIEDRHISLDVDLLKIPSDEGLILLLPLLDLSRRLLLRLHGVFAWGRCGQVRRRYVRWCITGLF